MRRFYCSPENITNDKIYLPASQAHHIKDVLRLKKNDKINIFDGKGKQYNCVITDLRPNEAVAKVVSSEFCLSKEASYTVTLAQALPNKPDKMDLVIEKATELGVDAVIPVAARRSVMKLSKSSRWEKIASEAARQCGRCKVPEIKEIMPVEKAVSILSGNDIKLFPCIDKDTITLRDTLEDFKCRGMACRAPAISVFIGPEGDFTKEEINTARQGGFKLVSLGERVLRTETAGLYVLSVLDYVMGNGDRLSQTTILRNNLSPPSRRQ